MSKGRTIVRIPPGWQMPYAQTFTDSEAPVRHKATFVDADGNKWRVEVRPVSRPKWGSRYSYSVFDPAGEASRSESRWHTWWEARDAAVTTLGA